MYHWPPTGSPTSWTGRREYGDADLAGWIREYQPDLVLAGHVHESPFKPDGAWADRVGRTWVFNPGNQIGPVPAHIVLDLDADRATWVSMLGTEEIDLAAEAVSARTGCSDQYSGSGSLAEPLRAGGSCRCASRVSTVSTMERPGTSPYWCFRSAR